MNNRLPSSDLHAAQTPKSWSMHRLLAWTLYGLCLICALLGLTIELINRVTAQSGSFLFTNAIAIAICFPIVGLVIALHQPQNPVGWLFYAMGLGPALSLLGVSYTIYTYYVNPGLLPAGKFMSWIGYWAFIPGFTLIPFLLLLFPNGRLLSPRWRWAVWAIVLGVILSTVRYAWLSWQLRGAELLPYIQSGIDVESNGSLIVQIIETILVPLTVGGFLAAVVAMVLRFRRSRGVERQQMKWFAYALVLAVSLQLVIIYAPLTHDPNNIPYIALLVLQTLSIIGVALAVGIAILRYRLYDIDMIINRTLVYGALTTSLGLIYVGSVVLLQQILSPVTKGSELAVVGSTLVTVALFTPLHRRIQNIIDRHFYRRKYDARKTLAAFSVTVRDEVELGKLAEHLLSSVETTMQPEQVSLWLRPIEDNRKSGMGTK